MGGNVSTYQQDHAGELRKLLGQREGPKVGQGDLEDLVREIQSQCPWYPQQGSLKPSDWDKIGQTLHAEPRAAIHHLLLWQQCAEAISCLRVPDNCSPLLAPVINPVLNPPETRYPQLTLPAPLSHVSDLKTSLIPPSAPPDPDANSTNCQPSVADFSQPHSLGGMMIPQAIQEARRSGVLTLQDMTEFEGTLPPTRHIQAYPVTQGVNAQGVAIQQWEPLPFGVIRELNKAVRESGIQSTYVMGMIEGIGVGYTMAPQDWKDLMRMILSPSQYVVWDMEYRLAATAAGTAAMIPDQIYGSGAFAGVAAQSQLPAVTFDVISQCIQRAFRRVPVNNKPTKSFTDVKQEPAEAYHQFIDRLKEAIARQIDSPAAQVELLKKLAFEQANIDCKKVLTTVIHRQNYELADMIQACMEVGTQTHTMTLLAGALRTGSRPSGNCYNCQKPGHFKKDCKAPGGGAHKGTKPSKLCPRCKKGYHWATHCRTNPVNPSQKASDNKGN
ncbi:endogenous retrovirus group K member 24 Gag polyprotein-like [Anolis sagrei]|uniref:endogenous retrovirus group K member 24 Gag polyprotein-like n=1 Tax=Anolis sagrei TaxID=38937 RepID=UPI003520CEF9